MSCQNLGISWYIHGAATYGVPWIPSIYLSHVSIEKPAPWIYIMGYIHGISPFPVYERFPNFGTTDDQSGEPKSLWKIAGNHGSARSAEVIEVDKKCGKGLAKIP